MAALVPVAGLQAVWSADEGALLYQIRALSEGAGWAFEHPFPEADPDGTAFAIHLSSWADDTGRTDGFRYVVLAKHPAYLWLATGLFGLGGYGLVVALSVASGLATAIATSRLAWLLDHGAEAPALWVSGLASPLLLHSYVAWGHTVAAALVGWGTYGLLSMDHPQSPTTRLQAMLWPTGAGLGLLFAACLIRTEAPLAVLAIGLALVVQRRPLGLAVVVVGVAGRVVDQLTDVATGGPVEPVTSASSLVDVASGRIEAFTITWLQPSYGRDPIDLTIGLAAACVLAAAVLARRGRAAHRGSLWLLAIAVGALLVRFVVAPSALVPGLVVAFPALFGGLALMDRSDVEDRRAQVLLGGFVLFCGAVLATQYRQGGGGEWGGRYFAVGLPFGVALAAAVATRAGREYSSVERRRLTVPLVASMVLLSTLGILGLRVSRQMTDELTTEIAVAVDRLASTVEPPAGEPVVVTTIAGLGRWMWADIDDGRWLRVDPDDLSDTAGRLHRLGVEELILVTRRPDDELGRIEPWFEPLGDSGGEVATGQIITLRATPSPGALDADP